MLDEGVQFIIVYENKPIWSFNDAFAFLLIHGVLPRPNDVEEPLEQMSDIWKISQSFPIDDSEWCPYHKPESMPFSCENNQVKISGYKHLSGNKEEWLVFIANSKTNEIKECDILGFNDFDVFTDAYNNKIIYFNNGKLTIDFKRFAHYILKVVSSDYKEG